MRINDKRGFTLIEVIVVAGIIAILAGILVPLIFNQVDESRKTRALADCKSIQTATMTFRKDTGVWPNKSNPTTADKTMLIGNGTPIPDADLIAAGFDNSNTDLFRSHLKDDATATYGQNWKGPYLTLVEADPWGNAYISNIKNANDNPATPVWIVSAGPNGKLETLTNGNTLQGDDVGILLK